MLDEAIDDRPQYDKPVLCIDYDGTLTQYKTGWKGLHIAADEPTDGAMDFLKEAMNHFTVFIHSARSATEQGRSVMKSWLLHHYSKHHGLSFAEATVELSPIMWSVSKPHAHVSIDDRAINFAGHWPAMEDIKNFRPWNR